jgi:2-polyprenyl-6-hydroxyphenyl methylase/3-demethylubiquinone-9 3-methyltransferase
MVESQRQIPPLHKFNPVRLTYIRDHVAAHFGRDPKGDKPLQGLRLLDIGCGGGLLCEPMARMGAEVLGADASRTNVEVASIHAANRGPVHYEATTSEELAARGERFDIVLNMEVVEHVADVDLFLNSCAEMVKPGGLMFVATINRTMKAMALAIIGAEYVLRWLPRGTHQYEKLVRPGGDRAAAFNIRDECHRSHRRVLQSASGPVEPVARYGRQLHDARRAAEA